MSLQVFFYPTTKRQGIGVGERCGRGGGGLQWLSIEYLILIPHFAYDISLVDVADFFFWLKFLLPYLITGFGKSSKACYFSYNSRVTVHKRVKEKPSLL